MTLTPRDLPPIPPHAAPAAPAADPRDETEGGDVGRLIRAQARAALMTCGAALAVMVGFPLLAMLAPELSKMRPYGIPLSWMGLAFAAQPLWAVLAAWHVRCGERIERRFLKERRESPGGLAGTPAPWCDSAESSPGMDRS